jgi:hypothetical protein
VKLLRHPQRNANLQELTIYGEINSSTVPRLHKEIVCANTTYTATCFAHTTIFKQNYIISYNYSTDNGSVVFRLLLTL